MRVLCLDIEGGYGGSSRSLFQSIRHMPRGAARIEVWCGRDGPIRDFYRQIDIPVRVEAGMPRFSALPRFSRNLLALASYRLAWHRAGRFRQALAGALHQFDLVHLNHESLHGIGMWLKGLPSPPVVTMHVRTMLVPSRFARWQSRRMAAVSAGLAFITENERDRFLFHLRGCPPPPYRVIYNIAEPLPPVAPHAGVPRDGRLVIACLSNYAWVRGVDRVIDVAAALKARGRNDILFVMAGDMALPRSLPGALGVVARQGGDLAAYARNCGVADMMHFLGHIPNPEAVLAASDLLIKPTREANPWGRDIIEALAAGRPVLSVGRYNRFVEDGVSGILQAEFDAADLAAQIEILADDRSRIAAMGRAGANRVAALCAGPARATDLLQFWQHACGNDYG